MLSIEELRRWCRGMTRRGQGAHAGPETREFATMAFLRAVGFSDKTFYGWIRKGGLLPANVHAAMSKFVEEWDAGILEFKRAGANGKVALGRRAVPRVRTRMAIDFSGRGARLNILPRRSLTNSMPTFPEVAGVFDRKVSTD